VVQQQQQQQQQQNAVNENQQEKVDTAPHERVPCKGCGGAKRTAW
jgi:hypothetical protein